MINKSNDTKKLNSDTKKQESVSKKPNETGGVYFSSHLKIFDPVTKEVLVKKRGDE
jgi:hypothetical protein